MSQTVLLLLCYFLAALQPSGGELVKIFKVDRITNCESSEPRPVIILPGYGVEYIRGVNSFNCTLRISEELKGPLKYVASIKRCEMDLSKCEFFNKIESKDLCEHFNDTNFRQGFINNVSPPFSCPVQPADYRFTNNRWDMSSIANLPGSAYRWKITATITQTKTGREVYCTEMMARIVVTRKKGNRIKH